MSAFLLIACGGPSLEKYYVENQENDNFVVLNIPADILISNDSALSEKEKASLESIEKANVLAFPLNAENKVVFEEEKTELEQILKNKKYKLLMKFGGSDQQFKLMYTGDSEAIDEMVVYGASKEMGFGVARILGDNMNPNGMIKLMKALKNSDAEINLEGIEAFGEIFEQKRDSL